MERADDTFSSQRTRGYRLTIFKQLQQAVEAMHRPEEMFQWLASVMAQRFDVPIFQLWTRESAWPGQPSAQKVDLARHSRVSKAERLVHRSVAPSQRPAIETSPQDDAWPRPLAAIA